MLLFQEPTPQAAPANALALQAKLADLSMRLNELAAQRPVVVERTRADNASVRVAGEQNLLNLDMELASVKAQLAATEALLGQNGGGPGAILLPPPPASPSPPMIDPDAITAVFVLTSLAILIPLSIGISRRLWRRPAPPISALEDRISPRLDRLEQAVDAIAIEVERISEGQRFVTKVLSERATSPQVPNGSVSSEPQAYLALGAGPMEPIRQAERQSVKQSVTPH
jgi:hypothetical protein